MVFQPCAAGASSIAPLRAPYLGPTLIRIICARFACTSPRLSPGVQLPLLDAVKAVVTNGLLRDAVEKSREEIREGHGMAHTRRVICSLPC